MPQWVVAFAFGLIFVAVMLYIALKVPNPTDSQWFIFRVILALAAGGIGAVLPGIISVSVAPSIRATGAVAFVILVFWFNPPKLVAGQGAAAGSEPAAGEEAGQGRLKSLGCDILDSLKSAGREDKTVITFDNKRSAAVSVYWIDFEGHEQPYGEVAAQSKLVQNTFLGHAWVVRDGGGNCLAAFLAAWRDGVAEIG